MGIMAALGHTEQVELKCSNPKTLQPYGESVNGKYITEFIKNIITRV